MLDLPEASRKVASSFEGCWFVVRLKEDREEGGIGMCLAWCNNIHNILQEVLHGMNQ